MVKCWPDYTYAIANAGWDSAYFSNTSFGNLDGDVWDGDYDDTSKANWINKEDLLVQDAATPVYVTHKVLGGVTYAFNKWEYPLMFGFGGSWEFTQGTNSALDGYALWTKLGITF